MNCSANSRVNFNAGCEGGKYTDWYDRDNPSGEGDYETLNDLRKSHPEKICPHPSYVDARVIATDLPHSSAGQNTHSSLTGGFWCNNKDNPGTSCLDYKVRFCCPDGKMYKAVVQVFRGQLFRS